ncbi:unnamed protein product [Vitrella brassicaformis CCMP3155]|uniref:Uncharacterized protein n=1 Tax=Vitrella brassicaformis (strain CCMP3155) TaxID=1169540 RepID=A0A0G4G1F6_VITBC|nr:unnamed protein product [Vitrella brassicaformis CCMP3155]|eukprot:CEM21838.1 unnamed protein product [Vitrella brassicaformis CCMP3155]
MTRFLSGHAADDAGSEAVCPNRMMGEDSLRPSECAEEAAGDAMDNLRVSGSDDRRDEGAGEFRAKEGGGKEKDKDAIPLIIKITMILTGILNFILMVGTTVSLIQSL